MKHIVESLGSRGVNPQEATIPEDEEENEINSPSLGKKIGLLSSSSGRKKKKKKKGGKKMNDKPQPPLDKKNRKGRNRVAYVASVNNCYIGNGTNTKDPPAIPLPLTQYATILSRRAIRKREVDNPPSSSPTRGQKSKQKEDEFDKNDTQLPEEYGDISLGMKLSVVGGKVIVQKLNSLSDGRASPAQVTGVIQRGDVLLSIDNKSLVNLPIDLMMERLKPLSTPDSSGAYQKLLRLRLSAGAGLEMLVKYEAAEARKAHIATDGAASEVFSLFPMVDQLSGMPLFDNNVMRPLDGSKRHGASQHQEEKKQAEDDSSAALAQATEDSELQPGVQHQGHQQEKSVDELISSRVAQWRIAERNNFTSEYYAWNDSYSELLRPSEGTMTIVTETNNDRPMTRSEMLDRGRKALVGAETLSRLMENIDRGKDLRSFKSWNSSISLRSRAGTRRRYVLDAVSLPVRFDMKSASPKGANAGASLASDASERSELDEVDGDALLLRLAAHDEIWRSQVIDALKNAQARAADSVQSEESEDEGSIGAKENMDDAITKELGTFLFGETLAKVVTKKKKSKALPPDEITAVLFDLSTNLASSMPDEVAVGGGTASGALKSSLVPFMDRKSLETGSSVILATRFVLDEALPVWLETFRPLPWESRRVLWPQAKLSPNSGGRSPSMFSETDSLTLDSGMSPTSAHTGVTNGTRNQTKNLRQQIEDQELDVETRAETCFLVTYHFTHKLLPKLSLVRTGNKDNSAADLVGFVKKFGAYMKLHTCMAYAAVLKCECVISELLALAEHDMRHREVMKLFQRRQALILYDPSMLSAIVKCLPMIRKETNIERRQVLVDVCVSAYPDLCAWQVRQALVEFPVSGSTMDISKDPKPFENLYYYYLSSLLHPQDGHEAARHDANLVQEWCSLSLDISRASDEDEVQSRRSNFLCVASLNSSDHMAYHRDLPMLLELSMANHEYDLALDLANEVANNTALARKEDVLGVVLNFLREIAQSALDKTDAHIRFRTLKRTLRLFHQLSQSSDAQVFSFAEELNTLWKRKEEQCSAGNKQSAEVLELIHFMAREAPPSDFLEAFYTWTATHEWHQDTVAVLQSVLKRGTRVALNTELSGSLLRLRRARQRIKSGPQGGGRSFWQTTYHSEKMLSEPTVWSLVSQGLVAIDK